MKYIFVFISFMALPFWGIAQGKKKYPKGELNFYKDIVKANSDVYLICIYDYKIYRLEKLGYPHYHTLYYASLTNVKKGTLKQKGDKISFWIRSDKNPIENGDVKGQLWYIAFNNAKGVFNSESEINNDGKATLLTGSASKGDKQNEENVIFIDATEIRFYEKELEAIFE